MIVHIVLFEPKAGLDVPSRLLFAQSVVTCLRGVPTIKRVTVGKAISTDIGYDRNMGDSTYEFAACIEFDDDDGLKQYLEHPLHNSLGEMFWRYCERSVVTDIRTVDISAPGADSELAGYQIYTDPEKI